MRQRIRLRAAKMVSKAEIDLERADTPVANSIL